jgi:hypothetical protein
MKSKSFPYQKVSRFAAYPMLPIELQAKTEVIHDIALIDSGAEISVLPYDMGLKLGLDWYSSPIGTGLAGRVKPEDSRLVVINLLVEPFQPFLNVFLWIKSNEVRLIVGQANFLVHFDVLLSARKQEFILYETGEA